jgi:hypothetical protein
VRSEPSWFIDLTDLDHIELVAAEVAPLLA